MGRCGSQYHAEEAVGPVLRRDDRAAKIHASPVEIRITPMMMRPMDTS
jgi:hypothetical protein